MDSVFSLYQSVYLKQYQILYKLTKEELQHKLMTKDKVVYTLVIEDPQTGEITEFISLFNQQLAVNQQSCFSEINVANLYMYAYRDRTRFQHLFKYMIYYASTLCPNNFKFDTFTMNETGKGFKIAVKLSITPGSEATNYYMYNYNIADSVLMPNKVNAPIASITL